jgi:hypothetical protein
MILFISEELQSFPTFVCTFLHSDPQCHGNVHLFYALCRFYLLLCSMVDELNSEKPSDFFRNISVLLVAPVYRLLYK